MCEEHPDVVILASSILSLETVVAQLPVTRLRRSTLFVDVCSVKEFPKRLMLSLLPPEVGAGVAGVFWLRPSPARLRVVPARPRDWLKLASLMLHGVQLVQQGQPLVGAQTSCALVTADGLHGVLPVLDIRHA